MWRAEFLTLPVETRENKRAIMPVMKKKFYLLFILLEKEKVKEKYRLL